MVVHCWMCFKVASPTLKGIVRHIGNIHAHESNFFVNCGINLCTRTYTNFYSFKKHIYRKHRSELDCSDLSQSTLPLTEDEEHDCTYYDDNQTEIVTECEATEDRKRISALFLLKTKEVHKVTQKALDGVIQDMSSFIKLITDSMEHDIRQCLDQNNITLDTNLSNVFLQYSTLDPFQGLHSKYLQEQYYHDFLGLLVCCKGLHVHYLCLIN